MKKILALILACVLVVTVFVACSKESEAVDGTTTPTTQSLSEAVDETIDTLTEDVSVESTTIDDDGNTVVKGTDADGNTVEIKTDSTGTVTKTVTDKTTGKRTEQTTQVTTRPATTAGKTATTQRTANQTTAKQTTTQRQATTAKSVAQTTKPTTKATTTAHQHNWVKQTRQELVKEAWTETLYAEVEIMDNHATPCPDCGYIASTFTDFCLHFVDTGHTQPKFSTVSEPTGRYKTVEAGTVYHPAEYKTVTYYKCSTCGATKDA